MKRRGIAWVVTFVVLGLMIGGAALANDAAKMAAEAAALPWLELVDRADYGGSWDKSAKLFQSAITRQKWSDRLSALRVPLGKLVSREVMSTNYITTMPGAPDGEYVVIQYNSSFEKKQKAIETVTPMKEKDGSWKVSGYFIR